MTGRVKDARQPGLLARLSDTQLTSWPLCLLPQWTSVALPRRMLWRLRDAHLILQTIVRLPLPLQPPHTPYPRPLGHARPTQSLDPHSSPPQFLRACPSTGTRRAVFALHHTLLLVLGVVAHVKANSTARTGKAHHLSVPCVGRAYMKSEFDLSIHSIHGLSS